MAEKVLSDVHIYTENVRVRGVENIVPASHDQSLVGSRFQFSAFPVAEDSQQIVQILPRILQDEDGDLIVKRKMDSSKNFINICHAMATPLSLVGLQVWRGALVLADFLLCNGENILKNKVVLELGAGTGLCSIIASLYARHVFATDKGDDILTVCHRNCSQNQHIGDHMATITIRELDWMQSMVFAPTASEWSWMPEENELLSRCTVILAADIVYDNNTTDAFLDTVARICKTLPVSALYLALEKRLNFTLDDLDVACPAYSYFFQQLPTYDFVSSYQLVPTTFHQSFQYERVPQLELWKISLKNVNKMNDTSYS